MNAETTTKTWSVYESNSYSVGAAVTTMPHAGTHLIVEVVNLHTGFRTELMNTRGDDLIEEIKAIASEIDGDVTVKTDYLLRQYV